MVVAVSVSANELVSVLSEHEVADLGRRLDAVQLGSCYGIPEADSSVCGTTSAGQNPSLMRIPRKGFHCCCVPLDLGYCGGRMLVPQYQRIIVASASQLRSVEGPLKPADLLLMTL